MLVRIEGDLAQQWTVLDKGGLYFRMNSITRMEQVGKEARPTPFTGLKSFAWTERDAAECQQQMQEEYEKKIKEQSARIKELEESVKYWRKEHDGLNTEAMEIMIERNFLKTCQKVNEELNADLKARIKELEGRRSIPFSQALNRITVERIEEVERCKTEIIEAFLAKYRFHPEETEVITQRLEDGAERWFIQRKSETKRMEKQAERIKELEESFEEAIQKGPDVYAEFLHDMFEARNKLHIEKRRADAKEEEARNAHAQITEMRQEAKSCNYRNSVIVDENIRLRERVEELKNQLRKRRAHHGTRKRKRFSQNTTSAISVPQYPKGNPIAK